MSETKQPKRRTKWGVVGDTQYVSSPRGGDGIAWTYDRAEAEMLIGSVKGGRVVDVVKWRREQRKARP